MNSEDQRVSKIQREAENYRFASQSFTLRTYVTKSHSTHSSCFVLFSFLINVIFSFLLSITLFTFFVYLSSFPFFRTSFQTSLNFYTSTINFYISFSFLFCSTLFYFLVRYLFVLFHCTSFYHSVFSKAS